MKAETILIQNAHLQRPAQRFFFAWITFLAWALWSYLWMPLITLVAWLLGLHTSYVNLFLLQHDHDWLELLQLITATATCMLIVMLWSSYNYFRFNKMARRSSARTYGIDEIAEKLMVEKSTAALLQTSSRMSLDFTDDGMAVQAKALVQP